MSEKPIFYQLFNKLTPLPARPSDLKLAHWKPGINLLSARPSVVWFDFFYRVFGRFVTRDKGRSKTRLKKIARKSPQPPKKAVTYLRHFFFFSRRPLYLGTGAASSGSGRWTTTTF
jgi:hypothetical protein